MAVQNDFFCRSNRVLNFGGLFAIEKISNIFCYDCLTALPYMKTSFKNNKNVMFHFTQKNHFAFDSMLYAPIHQTLFFIQITINQSHDLHYNELRQLIETNYTHEKDKQKYISFFKQLKIEYIKSFVFQWMTPKFMDSIETKSMPLRRKVGGRDFIIECKFPELYDEIKANQ